MENGRDRQTLASAVSGPIRKNASTNKDLAVKAAKKKTKKKNEKLEGIKDKKEGSEK